jgi:hypothetical protein
VGGKVGFVYLAVVASGAGVAIGVTNTRRAGCILVLGKFVAEEICRI